MAAPSSRGGAASYGGNSDEVKDQLTRGVENIVGNGGAFAAVKEDGSVVTWGSDSYGGNSDNVKAEFQGGVLRLNASLAARGQRDSAV